MKHPHAELIKQMLDDDTLRATYGDAFQNGTYEANTVYAYPDHQWRLVQPKPKTITIVCNGKTYELPEPMRVAPEVDMTYFVWESTYVSLIRWGEYADNRKCLANGRCHATREAAQQWVDAMAEIRGAK